MGKDIVKSPEMLEKEKQINLLYKQIKKERTTLKSLKTKLKNTKQKISDIQREMFNMEQNAYDRIEKLFKELNELLLHCRQFKNLSVDDIELIETLLSEVENAEQQTKIEQEGYEEYLKSEDFEETNKNRVKGMFNQFKVEPPAEEKKQIRKIYLKLSKKFHPDKAKSEKDRKSYHSLMQQIIGAYEANDIDKLLEFEQSFYEEEEVDLIANAITVDLLNQQINKLERDLNFISQQKKRTSHEIKAIRNSELGYMLSDIKKMEKSGFSLNEFDEARKQMLAPLENILKTLRICKKEKSIDKLYKEIEHIESIINDDFEDGFDIFGGDDEFTSFFDDDDWDEEDEVERIPVKNPKFPIGSSVKIKNDLFFYEDIEWNLCDEQGRVMDVFQDGSEIIYEIALDSKALKEMPSDLLDYLVDFDPEFNLVKTNSSRLKKSKPRDAKAQAVSAHRKILHTRIWNYLGVNEKQKMEHILLKKSTMSDIENWDAALAEFFKFPLTLTTCTSFPLPPNTDVQITGLEDYRLEEGHQFHF